MYKGMGRTALQRMVRRSTRDGQQRYAYWVACQLPGLYRSHGDGNSADFANDDGCSNHPIDVWHRRQCELASVPVWHGYAAVRRAESQSVCSAVALGRVDVRLQRYGIGHDHRERYRLVPDLGLPVYRNGGDDRLYNLREHATRNGRHPRTADGALHSLCWKHLVLRIQGYPALKRLDARNRGAIRRPDSAAVQHRAVWSEGNLRYESVNTSGSIVLGNQPRRGRRHLQFGGV